MSKTKEKINIYIQLPFYYRQPKEMYSRNFPSEIEFKSIEKTETLNIEFKILLRICSTFQLCMGTFRYRICSGYV